MLGAVIAFCAFAVPVAAAGATPTSACSARSGVTVIVDFTAFGGNIERGCDPGQPSTALAAVQAAGFATAGTSQYGDAFVCRIDGLPTPKKEACTTTPPAQSSWSFYHARPIDRAWTYSTTGVLTYEPPDGSLIAFAFGNFAKPGVLPSGATVTTTTSTTLPRRTTAPPTGPPVTALQQPPATTAPVAALPSTTVHSTAPTTPTTKRNAFASTSTTSAATTTGPRIVDKTAAAPVAGGDDSGSAMPAIVTVVLVAALGAGAFALVRARRRRAA